MCSSLEEFSETEGVQCDGGITCIKSKNIELFGRITYSRVEGYIVSLEGQLTVRHGLYSYLEGWNRVVGRITCSKAGVFSYVEGQHRVVGGIHAVSLRSFI